MLHLTGDRLKQVIQEYLVAKDLRPATINNKRKILRCLSRWLADRPLGLETCEGYKASLLDRGLQKSSVWQIVKVLRAFLRYCYSKKYLDEDIAPRLAQVQLDRRRIKNIVTADQAEQIIIAGTSPGKHDRPRSLTAKRHGRLALRFSLRTGLRISELQALHWEEIDLENGTFVVHSKGGNEDVLPLPADLVTELRSVRWENGKVFSVSSEALNAMIHRGVKASGLDKKMTVHTLRHIFASSLLKQGLSLQQTSRLLRHSSIAITDEVYSHFNVEDLRFALNAYHPIIHQGLSPENVYDLILNSLERSGILKDKRFKIHIDRSNEGLAINVNPASGS